MADVQQAINQVVLNAIETQEEFIFNTLYPFCEKELGVSISKADLETALQLLRLRNGMWISVKDRLPKVEGHYLCATMVNNIPPLVYQIQLWKDGRWYWVHDVRYWMPLPAMPKGGKA